MNDHERQALDALSRRSSVRFEQLFAPSFPARRTVPAPKATLLRPFPTVAPTVAPNAATVDPLQRHRSLLLAPVAEALVAAYGEAAHAEATERSDMAMAAQMAGSGQEWAEVARMILMGPATIVPQETAVVPDAADTGEGATAELTVFPFVR